MLEPASPAKTAAVASTSSPAASPKTDGEPGAKRAKLASPRKFCFECGAKLEGPKKYCPNCGEKQD